MHAAVVHSFDQPPQYAEFSLPEPSNSDELVIDVVAAGLHPRVRSQADGSHYSSTQELPLVPGIDGVGRGPDGRLRYFVLPETPLGSMAEQTVVDRRRSVELPESADPVAVAAAMNPAMSSWVALRQRITFEPGQNVLVLGATGSAGQLAVQVARHLGAAQVFAAGRDSERLDRLKELGATDTVGVEPEALGSVAAEVDVVLDYLWGAPTERALVAVVTGRQDRSRPLSWIEVGSVAGQTASIPSAALRAARLQLVGSGQGSVSTRDIVAELTELAEVIAAGTFTVDVLVRPLSEVSQAWTEPTDRRVVLTP